MIVAKLNTGKIVRLLKGPSPVLFSSGQFYLVSPNLNLLPNKIDPRWVPETSIVWKIQFGEADSLE